MSKYFDFVKIYKYRVLQAIKEATKSAVDACDGDGRLNWQNRLVSLCKILEEMNVSKKDYTIIDLCKDKEAGDKLLLFLPEDSSIGKTHD